MLSNLTDKTQQLDYPLLTSEIVLLRIPRLKFNMDSWQIGDEFMNFAVEIISSTIVCMISSGYLSILDKEQKPCKVLNLTIWTKEKYLISLQDKPRQLEFTGWLEDKIFRQFYISNSLYLDKIINEVLFEILNKKKNYTNPGKAVLLELIKYQKLNIIESNQTHKWFSRYITVTINNKLGDSFKKHLVQRDELNLKDEEFLFIKKSVKRQLNKFQYFE